jgi:hypothetical protein
LRGRKDLTPVREDITKKRKDKTTKRKDLTIKVTERQAILEDGEGKRFTAKAGAI